MVIILSKKKKHGWLSKGAFGTWDGTGQDGTGRGVPFRVWCAKNGWNGLFHGTDFGCFCVPPPPWNGFVPRLWNTMFYHFKTNIPHVFFKNYTFVPSRPVPFRSVPSVYQTHPNKTANLGTVWYADGTKQDETGRDGTDDIRRNFVIKCYKFVFHGCGTGRSREKKWNEKSAKFRPIGQPVPQFLGAPNVRRNDSSRFVPSRSVPRTKRYLKL
ncbi:hypothetical protein DVH24_030124 [Malus domestica]|uniref:Uncharacterized protein n=1 Tax=Malus domestica TaxID=3750 RepID=A0A498I2V0_MALDO|nr:hypothetical protein DVH24_030124 [Malus domestica]